MNGYQSKRDYLEKVHPPYHSHSAIKIYHILPEHIDNVSNSRHQYGDLSISEGDTQRHFGAVFLVYRDTP